MSTEMLVTLTVVEIVALVIVLALFVILITSRLRSIAGALRHVSRVTIGAIQGHVFLVSPGAAILNRQLNMIAGALPAIAEKAEGLPARQKTHASSPNARAAPRAAWDPAIRRR